MNAQIEALHRLQVSDHKMVNLERRLAGIPKRLAELDADFAKLETMLQRERDKLAESHDFKNGQEMQLREEEEHIKASKQRLGTVTNSRELNATQREIDTTRRLATARSEKIKEITTAISDIESRIATMERGLGELSEKAAAERDRLKADQAKLERTLGKTQTARNKLLEAVDITLRRNYERIRKRTGGVGFVAARERRCTACKMQVAHSMYVALRKGDEILTCETCGRLLYWAGLFPAENEKQEPKPKAAPSA